MPVKAIQHTSLDKLENLPLYIYKSVSVPLNQKYMTTIKDIELHVERAVGLRLERELRELGVLPRGYRCAVRFQGPNRDKRRTADFGNNWDVAEDSIRIEFEAVASDRASANEATASVGSVPQTGPQADLIRALDRVENRPGYHFVSLKFFRDSALPGEGFEWAVDETVRQNAISDAINARIILTHRVPNPKSPQFPVTAVRLNRAAPQVQAVLGGSSPNPSYRPVAIRGEPLSATVLRGRR